MGLSIGLFFFIFFVQNSWAAPQTLDPVSHNIREMFQRETWMLRRNRVNQLLQRSKVPSTQGLGQLQGSPLKLNLFLKGLPDLICWELRVKFDEGVWITLSLRGHEDEWQSIEVPNVQSGSRALNVVVVADLREGFRPFAGKNKNVSGRGFFPVIINSQTREVDLILEPRMNGWFEDNLQVKVTQL